MKSVEKCSQSESADKSLAGTLMSILTNIKFDGSCTIHEHILEMTNLAARLKTMGMEVNENFLVTFILNSLPSEYGPFHMNYNTLKDKWNVHELQSMLIQEEARLKKPIIHSANLMGHKGAGKKNGKCNHGQLKIKQSSAPIHKKGQIKDKCRFCNKSGHYQKDCLKRKAWFENKGKHNALGFLTTRTTNPNERFIFMGNKVKVPVEAVGTYRLTLDTGHHLDLFDTFYVPSISRNLISLSKLDTSVERQLDRKVKILRSDKGGEYYGKYDENGQCPDPFAKFLESHGICAQYTMPGIPQQNGVAERRNQFDLSIDNDPVSFSQAIKGDNSTKWLDAMKEELKSMNDNEVWDLVELPKESKRVRCKWIFKTKRDSNGNIERYKARLVAKDEEVFMDQPEGFMVEGKEHMMETIPYASIVGSLLYAQTCTRPDISFAVDSDFAGCVDTRKFTFGYLFLLAEGEISWKSAKQSIIAASTMEAEFVACFEATVHGLWLRNFISGLGIVDSIAKPLRIYCDNSAAVFF
ncbi:Retrovirus-related Pol polyprotein from transposon TNT 1-94 [Cucumis melo var. makuwa]|uniref:Retrovirus-related Pol polyprotein from transposon TNT 1-94 n=1 Tax=Cucumis melo var. makuwa TaxID=1194695 RepID=A0A5D3DXF9_CUCMM|nr:Retrovirus-related Pol polyprotein from transposon TNT 1-94 [Cucumis melo var. makuwa]